MKQLSRTNYKLQESVNHLILFLKKRRTYRLRKGEIGINLGSELATVRSFVGVDGSFIIYLMKNPLVPKFIKRKIYNRTWASEKLSFESFIKKINSVKIIHHNLLYGCPLKDNSVKFIFSSHFIEHLEEEHALKLLKECFRVMTSNGRIRIIVPDLDEEVKTMERKIKQYKKTRDEKILQEYVTIPYVNMNYFSLHKRMYNFEGLKKLLNKAGFKNVKRMKRLEGDFPELNKLESPDIIAEGNIDLIVEAVK